MTRILLHCDQPVLAGGLEFVLSSTANLQLVGTCSTAPELPRALAELAPDILLLDLTPEVNFQLLSALRTSLGNCKIILWINEIPTELAFQALALGVCGILRKTLSAALLLDCLSQVQSGGLWYEKTLTDSFFAARRVVLTKRESQLVTLVSQGLKNKEIAGKLFISEGTVKVYLSRLFQKVGVKDRFELALFGLKNLATDLAAERHRDLPPTLGLRSLVVARQPGMLQSSKAVEQ